MTDTFTICNSLRVHNSRLPKMERLPRNSAGATNQMEEAINLFFIPALTGRDSISEVERELFALPTRLGGLGLTKPTEMAELEYTSSQKITAPLAALILIQQHEITYNTVLDQERAKTEVRQSRQQHQSTRSTQLHSRLPRHLQRAVELCSEKGASLQKQESGQWTDHGHGSGLKQGL